MPAAVNEHTRMALPLLRNVLIFTRNWNPLYLVLHKTDHDDFFVSFQVACSRGGIEGMVKVRSPKANIYLESREENLVW